MLTRAIAVIVLLTACGTEGAKETVPTPPIESPAPNQVTPTETALPSENPSTTDQATDDQTAALALSQREQEDRKAGLVCEKNSDCILHIPCCSCGGRQAMNASAVATNTENCKRRLCSACTDPTPRRNIVAVCEDGLCASKPGS